MSGGKQMRKLLLSLYVCCVVSALAWAGPECTRAENECNAAKAEADRMAVSNYGDVERNRDVFRAQQRRDSICGSVWGICEAERRREEERRRNL